MKGVVFTELIEMVESQLGLEVADEMIERSGVANGGAYSAVGTYDYHEILRLVTALSEITSVDASDLVRIFGRHLFHRFTATCPHFVADIHSTLELLPHVQRYIHVEVRKIHPNAELPTFECHTDTAGALELTYRSARPFADLAEGLILAAIDHYGDRIRLERHNIESRDGTAALFRLLPVAQPAEVPLEVTA